MSPSSPRSRPRRRAREATSLGLVGLLALPLIAWSNRVDVVVDGETHDLRTYAATVGDVLEQLEVDLDPADEVTPDAGTEVTDGLTIDVSRAIRVDVRVDGAHRGRVTAPVGSVAGVLVAAGLGDARERGAVVTPAWHSEVHDGDTVDVMLPNRVTVTADGRTHTLETLVSTVEAAVLEAGVELGVADLVTPVAGATLEDGADIVVQRVGQAEHAEEVVLAHGVDRRRTDELRRGTTRVEVRGRDGVRVDTYRVVTVDGEETGRELLTAQIVREPRDEVVLVGTAAPPPPPRPRPTPSPSPTPTPTPTRTPAPSPSPSPSPTATAVAAPATPSGSVWDRLAQCESGGNWSINTGNGYHGGLQFHPDTWNRHKPSGYPTYAYQATREQQIVVGERVQRTQGWGAWPSCSRRLGLR